MRALLEAVIGSRPGKVNDGDDDEIRKSNRYVAAFQFITMQLTIHAYRSAEGFGGYGFKQVVVRSAMEMKDIVCY